MSPRISGNLPCSITFSVLIWSILLSTCSGFVNWIYPGSQSTGLTFDYIDTVNFTWTSSISSPYMNLWCAPNKTSPQSKTQVYTAQVSTNGTNQQSFPYSEYENNGICHMQLEDFAGDDSGNTPTFEIISNDAVEPQTWGLSALSLMGGGSSPTATASSEIAVSSGFITMVLASSSASLQASSSSSPSAHSTSSATLSLTIPSSTTPSLTIPPSTTPSLTIISSVTPSLTIFPSATPSLTIPSSTTIRATAPITSPSSPSKTLGTAAEAAISVGTILGAIILCITLLVARTVWLRWMRGIIQDLNSFGRSGPHNIEDTAEIGGGAYFEMSGVARPSELHGVPRAELD